MRRMIGRLLAAVILTAGLGSPLGLADAARVYQSQQWQFQVAAPEAWFTATLEELVAQLTANAPTPTEAEFLKVRYEASGLVAIFSESSLARAKGLNPNCTISVAPLPEAARQMSNEKLLTQVRQVVGASEGMTVRTPLKALARKDCLAAQVEYEYQQQLGATAVPLVARVIALVAPANTYCVVITATAPASSFNSYAKVFDQVVSSFAFAPATP